MKIQDLARLSALEITPQEEQKMQADLDGIFKAFESIQAAPTDGVEELIQPFAQELMTRPDEGAVWTESTEFIENAPDTLGQLFKVPPVI